MYNQIVLSLAVTTVPILTFVFVCILLLHKLYVKIRSNFDVTANCWFCNQNTRVPYLESNCWTCPHCEQYNGFTKDGDYNRELFQQLDGSSSSVAVARHEMSSEHDASGSALSASKNGFCHDCNEAQRLKVEKLAQFEPKNESRFEEEYEVYKAKLEEQYRLCGTCERHLHKVLHEKKKMVLGSKFLDFIIKGAETLKQPHFNQVRHAQRQHWKRRLSLHISILTIVNLSCLCYMLPTLTREHLIKVMGDRFGERLFLAISHVLAMARVFSAYLAAIGTNPFVEKFKLFTRTIFMMLLYSLGLKVPQITSINFSSLYVLTYPFALLGMCLGYQIIDGFKLTRYTFLLALWSVFAGGLVEEQLYFPPTALMFLASALTLALSVTNEVNISPKLYDTSTSSFHKIYSEDYLTDEDTNSVLSQQFNCSGTSTVRSTSMGEKPSPLQKSRLYTSPITSSRVSLHNAPRTQFSPNSSYKSCYFHVHSNPASHHSRYAPAPVNDFNTTFSPGTLTQTPFIGSNWDIDRSERPRSTMIAAMGNNVRNLNANASFSHNSFSGETNAHHLQKQSNENFEQYRHGSSINQRAFSAALHSPFSLTSNALYQQQRPASMNLVTPSRFSTTCLASNLADISFSVGSLNQTSKLFPEQRQAVTTIEENISRASSQSSGFESQKDRLNVSRENSFNIGGNDLVQQTKISDATRGFQPISAGNRSAYSPRPSLLSHPPLVSPLTVNCGMTPPMCHPPLEFWSTPTPRNSICGRDIFNLRKINEELPLPSYKYTPGDLLKKWKESQMIS